MKNLSKIVVLSVLATFALSVSVPKKSEACIIIGVIGGGIALNTVGANNGWGESPDAQEPPDGWGSEANPLPLDIGLGLAAIIGVDVVIEAFQGGQLTSGGEILLLGANEPNQNNLAKILSTKYPFIDNSDAINSLADVAVTHVKAAAKGLSEIHVSESEVRTSLESADLTEAQLLKIAGDLK